MDDDAGLFRATFHDSPIGIAILDEVGHYQEVNRAFASILGLEPADVVSRNFAEFTHPDDLPRDIEMLSQLARKEFPYYVTAEAVPHEHGRGRVGAHYRDAGSKTTSGRRRTHFIAQIEDVDRGPQGARGA